jgi:hypothetical protein
MFMFKSGLFMLILCSAKRIILRAQNHLLFRQKKYI